MLRKDHRRQKTMRSAIVCLAMLVAISGVAVIPAAAQTTTEYYVVQDVKTKKCTIVEKKKPTTTTEVSVLGNTFKTRTEAETGMKTEKVCVSN
jgi:type IV secretory pathway component VirB8